MSRIRAAVVALTIVVCALAAAVVPRASAGEEPSWWQVPGPSRAAASAIGSPARGCLAGGVAMPVDGPGYQLMRLSRDRIYGHPRLTRFIAALAADARALGWPGILVGDLAQPRGGPMRSGHRSHQTGIDVDIWFTPAPPRRLTVEEREQLAAVSVVAADGLTLDAAVWTEVHGKVLRAAASDEEVDRIFVNAAIKKALCADAGTDRDWLRKIRPWWGHDDHFHVRLACPPGDADCAPPDPIPAGDGCDASLDWWLSEEAAAELRQPRPPAKAITLDDLPAACRRVLLGG